MSEIPQKSQYKLSEVCQYTDTQPYVLRFWESEFPQLQPEKTRSGQPVYTRRDLETVLRIKQLLQEEEQSIAEARALLDTDGGENSAAKAAAGSAAAEAPAKKAKRVPASEGSTRQSSAKRRSKTRPRLEPAEPPASSGRQENLPLDTISRERYENALDEIAHMKLELNDAEARCRRAEQELKKAEEALEGLRERNARAMGIIEEVVERLS